MKLVDLKTDGDADDFYGAAPDYAMPDYPWGARICLSNDELEKLGITTFPPVGAMFNVECVARVVCVSEDETDNGKGEPRRRMELQIMQMGAEQQTANGAAKLYRSTSDATDKD